MIQPTRIHCRVSGEPRPGAFVLYWMQAAQRARMNHALEFALERANALGRPLLVCFGLTDRYPEANARHYAFLLEGLADLARSLAARGIGFVLRRADPPPALALELAADACLVVFDDGHTRVQRAWRSWLAERLPCPCYEVENDPVVPLAVASLKGEVAARTLRPKLLRALPEYLVPVMPREARVDGTGSAPDGLDAADPGGILAGLDTDRRIQPVGRTPGGTAAALVRLGDFLEEKIDRYADHHGDPAREGGSGLSPYLQFGQIAALEVALAASHRGGAGAEAFLEQLVVRRELALNALRYNPACDTWEGLPAWARATLALHAADPRPAHYGAAQWEAAETHDPYWNAAMRELVLTGTMHNYMRMYWGKKLLEWSRTPQEGFRIALALNNRYQLDGRGANGFVGVAWCFGLHDRPWPERPVFGTVRSMVAKGLERKFDIKAYLARIAALEPPG